MVINLNNKFINKLINFLGGYTPNQYSKLRADLFLISNEHEIYVKEGKALYESFMKASEQLEEIAKINTKLNKDIDILKENLAFSGVQPMIIVENDQIKSLVTQHTSKYEILDGIYTIPTITELKQFLAYDKGNKKKWTREKWDCDNFATDLWAMAKRWNSRIALGFCTITLSTYRHAINFAIVQDGNIIKPVFIEPQSDAIYDRFPGMLKVDNIII